MIAGDENTRQAFPCSCAIKCQQLILQDYGFYIDEANLCDIAKENGWYSDAEGVFMHNNGKLLGCFGLEYHHQQNNTVEDIANELRLAHRVMANVNPDKLHYAPSESFRNHTASHSILINHVDKESGKIFIIDPMSGNIDEPCPISWFLHAWADSLSYMLATDMPAVYKYNPITKTMISLTNN